MFGKTGTIPAPAKINLLLEVLGQRPNGYHDLRSIVVPISLCDELVMEGTDGLVETVVEAGGEVDGDELRVARNGNNLATKAALALKEATGYAGGVRIHLKKNVPIGGGLGGGSSDAAVVLNELNRLWGTGLPKPRLMEIGTRLGCDIPALIQGGAVCMEGMGERVTPIPVHNGQAGGWWVVVANPGFSVSTRDIYERYKTTLTCDPSRFTHLVSALTRGDLELAASSLFNSLQDTVFRKYPLIRILAQEVEKAGAVGVLLCGSGASVFGLARDEAHARAMAGRLTPEQLGFPGWSRVARTLPDGVMVAHGPLEA